MLKLKNAYTTKELSPLLGITRQALDQRAKREGWRSRPRAGRGGGHEWLVASMPEATRAALTAALARNTQLSEHLPACVTPGNLPAPRVVPADVAIPEYALDRAHARYRIVTEWRNQIAQGKKKRLETREITESFLLAARSGVLFPAEVLSLAGGLSLPTIYKWNKELKEAAGDPLALADRRGGWMQSQPKGLGQIGEEAERLFLTLYLRPTQPTLKFAYRGLEMTLSRMDLPVPSLASVRRFLNRFSELYNDVVVWMREGEKAYKDKIGSYLSRDVSMIEVGDILVADGHKLNFLILNPATGKPCRMTLIGWEDWASTMFVGFELMVSENTQAISAALLRSIINLGKLPKFVYLDNGASFKNKFFSGEKKGTDWSEAEGSVDFEDFGGLYARLGIGVQHSKPYEARTKVIERWWGDFDRQCAVGLPHYTGASIEGKPAYLMRNEAWHKKWLEKQAQAVLTVEEAIEAVKSFAMWKALQPHPTRPNTTPWEVFSAGRGPGFAPADIDRLSREFLYRRKVNPSRCRFRMLGMEFESDVLHGINKELTAHYTPTDLSKIWIYDGPRLIGTAAPVAHYCPLVKLYGDETDAAKLKDGLARQARLRRDTRRMADEIAAVGRSTEGLTALPFNLPHQERRTPIEARQPLALPGDRSAPLSLPADRIAPLAIPAISAEEAAEITAITEKARHRAAIRPAYTAPQFFGSETERYEFLFLVLHDEGNALTAEDAAFMATFEASPIFTTVRRRYDALLSYYNSLREKIA